MNQNTPFKSRLFGFDKNMVLDYISQFSQQAQENEVQLTGRIGDLDSLRIQLEQQLGERDAQLSELTAKNADLSKVDSERQEMLEKLGEEIVRLRSVVEKRDREIQIQNERCRQLQFKVESNETKSKREQETPVTPPPEARPPVRPTPPTTDAEVRSLKAEMAALRQRIETMEAKVMAPKVTREDGFFLNRSLSR